MADDEEARFQADLRKAIALSLETEEKERHNKGKSVETPNTLGAIPRRSSYAHQDEAEGVIVKLRPKDCQRSVSDGDKPVVPPVLAPPPQQNKRRNQQQKDIDLISFSAFDSIDIPESEIPNPKPSHLSLQLPTGLPSQCFSDGGQALSASPVVSGYQFFPQKPLGSPAVTHQPIVSPMPPCLSGADKYAPLCLQSQFFPQRQAITNSGHWDVFKVIGKQSNENLIDLAPDNIHQIQKLEDSCRKSVLEAFDPLIEVKEVQNEPSSSNPGVAATSSMVNGEMDKVNDRSSSFYEAFDPFEYMYSSSRKGSIRDSTDGRNSDMSYSKVALVETDNGEEEGATAKIPPRPPKPTGRSSPVAKYAQVTKRNRVSEVPERVVDAITRKSVSMTKVIKERPLGVTVVRREDFTCDSEIKMFMQSLMTLRSEFIYSDHFTNPGLIVSPMIEGQLQDADMKVTVHCNADEDHPVSFKVNPSTTVEQIIMQVYCELKLPGEPGDYVLKVFGHPEYLAPESLICEYEYVHECLKFDRDIKLRLVHSDTVKTPFARVQEDDERAAEIHVADILPYGYGEGISYQSLSIILETYELEMTRFKSALDAGEAHAKFEPLVQAVKALCALLGQIETLEVSNAIHMLMNACGRGEDSSFPHILEDKGDFCVVKFPVSDRSPRSSIDTAFIALNHLHSAIRNLLELYMRCHRVDFDLPTSPSVNQNLKDMCELVDTMLVHVCTIHKINPCWHFREYKVACEIFHGTTPIVLPSQTQHVTPSKSLYERLVFDEWLVFDLVLCTLPRESRLVFTLLGYSDEQEGGTPGSVEIAWCAIQMFNQSGRMREGSFMLPLWQLEADKRLGPAPSLYTRQSGDQSTFMIIEIPDVGGKVYFPKPLKVNAQERKREFSTLDSNTQEFLMDLVEKDIFVKHPIEHQEILWERRHFLYRFPKALPKVLLAAHSWDWASLADLHALVKEWTPMEPVEALKLLLPCFPDQVVRETAVRWIQDIGSDELCEYLPQLVQALKHETYLLNPLSSFLMERALMSPTLAHRLYWLLMTSHPQGECETPLDTRFYPHLKLMANTLAHLCGESLSQLFSKQERLVQHLNEAAAHLKASKDSLRLSVLAREMEGLHHWLSNSPTSLPLRLSHIARGVDVKHCSYFPSFTLPLKVIFQGEDSIDRALHHTIYKVGDDLRQDILTMQIVRIMDRLWLRNGLDLKIVHFQCVATGDRSGFVEMVTDAETLRKIQAEHGLTGAFKDRPIAEWLGKHNPSPLEYEHAVENFTASCAGYSVATYVLGICDRHNDNIMLKTSGHLFHIDFGKFLGDAQMFGNIKRDRVPFVLTSDMVYVINGTDKPTDKFQKFVDYCCDAYNILRAHADVFQNLFALMASSGIPGVTMDAVKYVQKMLAPEKSNADAANMFTRMIEDSVKSWFTQVNFFLHSLAQLRFSDTQDDRLTLSFIPQTYTKETDGRILSATIYGYQKHYTGGKQYVYIVRIARENTPEPTYLFRSYKEFVELYAKLCDMFPCLKLESPRDLTLGRSSVKEVAERRKYLLQRFLTSLFSLAEEVCHCDLVYTFFHPLLRDQKDANIHKEKLKETKTHVRRSSVGHIRGELKLSIVYRRDELVVMVHHARNLALPNGMEPSTYVKVYLLPDHKKLTKRKTRIARRNRNPTFKEPLVYRMPLDTVRYRTLQASVYHYDSLQENEFLGAVNIPLSSCNLSEETTRWFPLGHYHG
ncbi:unnamed protein product [Darwinula stevensoni]|uniref:Phosphatidylinositol-4-phosphate 3-kinase n=1 Tax=Darwinula stevensoni TaxID=69355 RepID=A0A7R8XAA9_9CRUS|nr:unnamed protein product [Darwinula stevensoni]CAG0891228.1 unnamed protein product [Darwinula stevensoni]